MAITAEDSASLQPKTTKWGDQDVVTSQDFKDQIAASAKIYNQGRSPDKQLTAEQYDRLINPKTAGARWGDTPPPATPTPGGGLLSPTTPSGSAPTPQAPVPQATATTYDPIKQTVSDKSTVQNQVANIVSSGSPLNTLAETAANKAVNRRGLLNSSIAVGAGQEAVLKSALPIAQQDAATYANTDAANAGFSNTAAQFNAAAKNTTSQFNAQLSLQQQLAQLQANTQLSLADKDAATRKILQQMDANTKMEIAKLDIGSKEKLTQVEADNRQLLQTNISAANLYSQYVTNLSNISLSDKLDAGAKQQAADNQLAALQAALKSIGEVSKLDLSKYFQAAGSMSQQGTGGSSAPGRGSFGPAGSLIQDAAQQAITF